MENQVWRTNKETVTSIEYTKEDKTHSETTEWKVQKKTTADTSDNTTGSNKLKDIGEKRRLKRYRGRVTQY